MIKTISSSTVTFYNTGDNGYASVFTTDHGRKVFISIRQEDYGYVITDCRYLDRAGRAVPKKLRTKECHISDIDYVIEEELDKTFTLLDFNDSVLVTTDEIIANAMSCQKPRPLIFLAEGDVIRTMFKNRCRRTIYLEIKRQGDTASIHSCYYTDERDGGRHRIPDSLVRFSCRNKLASILLLVNEELEGGFTNILITEEHNINLQQPICGAI